MYLRRARHGSGVSCSLSPLRAPPYIVVLVREQNLRTREGAIDGNGPIATQSRHELHAK